MSGDTPSGDRRSIRLTAWILGVVVVCIYVGYIIWNLLSRGAT